MKTTCLWLVNLPILIATDIVVPTGKWVETTSIIATIAGRRWTEGKRMKRKTFVKQLMAIGIPRNEANSICRRGLEYTAKQRAYGLSINITWEYNLGDMCEQFDRMPTQEWLLEKWGYETVCKYRQWLAKRSKEDPRRSWSRNHPNGY